MNLRTLTLPLWAALVVGCCTLAPAQTLLSTFSSPRFNFDDLSPGGVGGGCCQHILIDPDTRRAYELDQPLPPGTPSRITIIDIDQNAVVGSIALPDENMGLTFGLNSVTKRLYVADRHKIVVADTRTNQITSVDLGDVELRGGFLTVDSVANRIYGWGTINGITGGLIVTLDGATNQVTFRQLDLELGPPVANPTTGCVFFLPNAWRGFVKFDPKTGQITVGHYPETFNAIWGMPALAINSITNKLYIPGFFDDYSSWVAVVDGDTFEINFVPTPGVGPVDGFNTSFTGLAVDSARNRLYLTSAFDGGTQGGRLVTLFGDTNTTSSFDLHEWTSLVGAEVDPLGGVAVDSQTGRIFVSAALMTGNIYPYDDDAILAIDPLSSPTASGSNISVQADALQLTFSSISTAGSTAAQPIDPASIGQIPGGFSVSNSVAFEVHSTAIFSGPVTIGFHVPMEISLTDFNNLFILHNSNGTLMDVTAVSPARDYASRTIYATTDSFSPFYLARRGNRAAPLFDQTRAYKAGSTIPVKVQILSSSGANISSAALPLTIRGIKLIGGGMLSTVQDSGSSSPDNSFRYDSTLGGNGGYIFNLSTKGMNPGLYSLSFYAGTERGYMYTVAFEIR